MLIYTLMGLAILWMMVPANEPAPIPTHEVWVAVNFGYPTRDCFGRGRICRLEPISDSTAARPEWTEAIAVLRSEPEGGLSFFLWPPGISELVYREQFPNDTFLLDSVFLLPDTLRSLLGQENPMRALPAGSYPLLRRSEHRHQVPFPSLQPSYHEEE